MTLLSSLRHVARRPVVTGRVPDHLRHRYPALYDSQVSPTDDGGARFDRARLWRRAGLNVLYLNGDRFEMAFQHGRLLRDAIGTGTLDKASRIAPNAIRNSVGNGPLARVVSWYADTCIAEPMLRHGLARVEGAHDEHLSEAYGLAEGCGVSVRTILRAALGPETAQTLLGLAESVAVGGAPQCSSFAAWGSATEDGQMIIGRNTDYPLNGYFDTNPTVLYFDPTDGAQRYMTITSAGFHNAGVCGMNERGLYLAIHTVPASGVSEQGLPVFMVGQQVLREASTLEGATALLEQERPAAGWNYHMVSTRERKAMTFELCNAQTASRPCEGDMHATTNHWTQPGMLPHHLFTNSTVETDTRARKARMEELVDDAAGNLDAAAAAAILGDTIDRETGRARCFPNTIATTHTVSSSVWLPDSGVVYVGATSAPTAQGSFVALPTIDALDPDTLADAPLELLEATPVGADAPGLMAAQELVIAARVAFEYDNDARSAADLLARAAEQVDDPAVDVSWALMEIRAGSPERAAPAVARALQQDWDPRRRVIALYVGARLAAARGETALALADLRAVTEDEHADDRLVVAARATASKLGRRQRVPLRANDVAPMGWLPDAFRFASLSFFEC
jgi:hypothetical protein